MDQFKVIPVIDLLYSEAVHAIKGDRSNYKPLESKYFNTTNPYDIIEFLNQNFDFKEFYIADLDSIMRKKPNLNLILELLENLPIEIMLDPGIIDDLDLRSYHRLKLSHLIIGLETINNLKVIENAINMFGNDNIILSIDMYNEKVISNIKELKNLNPIEIMKKIVNLNVSNYILLDLYKVGRKLGDISQIYLEIREKFDGNFIVGGGIRDFNEIMIYKDNNFSGVIIATALYDGTINMEKIRTLNQL